MKIGKRGQVTIPKKLREQLGLKPFTEVELFLRKGELASRKNAVPASIPLAKWTGFLNGQPEDVDDFMEEVRGS